jgi:replicative DNA helicase
VSWLKPEDFFEPVHGRIFAAMLARYGTGEMMDAIALRHLFETDAALCDLDGGRYLAKLAASARSIANAYGYAKLIKRLSRKRALIEAAQALIARAQDRDDMADPAEILADASKAFDAVAEDPTTQDASTAQQVADAILHAIENPVPLWTTGLSRLDDSLGGGIPPGYAIGLEARPKSFKTGTMHTLWVRAAAQGKRAHYFALEMGAERLVKRVLAHAGGFNSSMFRHCDQQLINRVVRARGNLPEGMTVDSCPGLTFDRLKASASEYVLRRGVEVFFLDYWQLVRPNKGAKNKTEHLDDVAQWCADFAHKHGVTFVIASQENREGMSRGSDGLIMACDWFSTLHKHEENFIHPELGPVETLWFDVKYSRDGAGEPLGGPEEPAFFIHKSGPHLAEL